ncbi:MAG: Hsp20/alpha crystallin family protein [Thaumarchaeota archaeon]|nr:Hsp20/alpha crystallin family protein [Nitrososphaerota archaeon]
MKVRKKTDIEEMVNSILLVVGIVVLGTIVVVVTRFQRGLLAFVLSALAVGLLIFWLVELRRMFKSPDLKGQQRKWTYDIIAANDEITFVAEVPGPDDTVMVELNDGKLRVKGTRDFAKEVELREQVELISSTCVNGILNVRLRKVAKQYKE